MLAIHQRLLSEVRGPLSAMWGLDSFPVLFMYVTSKFSFFVLVLYVEK